MVKLETYGVMMLHMADDRGIEVHYDANDDYIILMAPEGPIL